MIDRSIVYIGIYMRWGLGPAKVRRLRHSEQLVCGRRLSARLAELIIAAAREETLVVEDDDATFRLSTWAQIASNRLYERWYIGDIGGDI